MIKQFSILALVAGVIILGMEEYKELINALHSLYLFFYNYLESIFSTGKIGIFLSEFFSVLITCAIVTGIPASIYRLALKKQLPRLVEIATIVVLLTTASMAYL